MTQIAKREAILAQLFTTLQTVTLPGKSIMFHRNTDLPFENDVELALMDGWQKPDYGITGQVEQMMALYIEGHIVDDNPGSAVNALFAATVATLLADHTAGGLAQDMFEGELDIDYERGADNRAAMQFSLQVMVKYQTTHAHPYTNI